jgi:excisionase family DNA binding protein
MHENKLAYSIEEAADCTGIGRNTIRKLIEWNKLPVLRVGRKLLIRVDTMEYFIRLNEGSDLRDRDAVKAVSGVPIHAVSDVPVHTG